MSWASRTRPFAELARPASEPHCVLKNTTFRASAISHFVFRARPWASLKVAPATQCNTPMSPNPPSRRAQ